MRKNVEKFLLRLEGQGWFSGTAYKPLQGQRVRRGTIFGLLLIVGAGVWTLMAHGTLRNGPTDWQVNIPFTGRVTIEDEGDLGPPLDEPYPDRPRDPAVWVKIKSPGDAEEFQAGEYVRRWKFNEEVAALQKATKARPEEDTRARLVVSRYVLRDLNEKVDPSRYIKVTLKGNSSFTDNAIVERSQFEAEAKKLESEDLTPPVGVPPRPATGPTSFETITLLPSVQYTVPLLLLGLALWLSWRVINMPNFADFLIATEAELNKVSWTTRRRLVQDTIVVLVTVFLMAVFLFAMDQTWRVVLSWKPIGVIRVPEGEGEKNIKVEQKNW
jgi:preprotein translocase SecE subunit